MAFPVPTLDDLHGFLISLFKVIFPEQDISEGSFNWLFLRVLAAAATDNHSHIDAVATDLMPDTALEDMQDRWAKIVGRERKGATGARGSKALRVFGNPLASIPSGETSELTSAAGLRYQITTADVVGPDGYTDVDVAAIDTGSATKLSAKDNLTFSATPVGLVETAELQLALVDGGDDEETPGELALRIVDRFKNPPLGGAQHDYEVWALEETDIAAAYAYPLRAGLGTVDLVAFHAGTGSDRILTPTEVANLQAYIDTKRPVSVKGFRVLQVNAVPTDVDFTVVTDGSIEHVFDWDDTTPPTVLAFTALTREVQVAGGSLPATLQAGDRISVKPLAGGGTGKERVVEAISAVDKFILEVQQGGDDPAVGDTLYAGGPLVEPMRQAIIALFDSLGAANPDSKRYGAWEGNLRPSAISRVATGVAGVLDGTVVAPGVTVVASDPPFPADTTIELLTPRRILVRAEH